MVMLSLPPASSALLTVLAGLEDDDRTPSVLTALWPVLWGEFGQARPAAPLPVAMAPLDMS